METGMLAMVLQSLLGLALVLGLFALLIWGVRRFQQQSGSRVERDFRIVQRLHLDSKNSLVEVRHRGRCYLLGLSPAGIVELRGGETVAEEAASETVARADDHAA